MEVRITGFRSTFIRCVAFAVLIAAVSGSAAVVNVSVVNNAFQPASVTIHVNDEVTWTWNSANSGVPHTTTSQSPALWDSGIHTEPFEFTVPFPSAGTFPYVCTLHAGIGMRGTVTVEGSVNLPPSITTQPTNQTVTVGDTVTFTVVATGTPPLSYQWKKNAVDIPGANGPSLTLTTVTSTDSGSYNVVVSNLAASVPSDSAVLTVNSVGSAPVITTQPASQTVTAGDAVTFTVVASGDAPLSYQWKKGGTDIPGANTANLTLTAVTTAAADSYAVVVSNPAGSTTSDAAVLTVNSVGTAPVISTQPASQTVTAGDTVTFTVVATGTAPLSYQWKQGGTDIPGANTANLTLTAVTTAAAGNYTVVVSSPAGSTTSDAAVLTVNSVATAPVITTQPASKTVNVGANVTFSVVATGNGPLSYQWKKAGTDIPGATASSLTLSNVQTNDAGSYLVMVSNSVGAVTSAEAMLTVQTFTTVTFAAGSFNGLFSDPNGVSALTAGSVAIKMTATGKFTGKLFRGGVRSSLSGQFDLTGHVQKTISGMNQQPVTVDLQVDLADPDRITGTVNDGTFTANLLADRAGFDGRQNMAPQAGRYTLVIDGNEDDSTTTPGGYSFGTVMVTTAGGIRLAGTLADASKLTQSVSLSKNGDWPLFVSLYGGRGSIMSWLKFAETDSQDFGGEVVWIKPSVPQAKLYPAGFSFNTTAYGSRYQAAPKVLSFTNGQLALEGGGLSGEIINQITIDGRNRVTNLSGNKLSLTFSASTGLFSGKVMAPGSATLIPFKGAVLQKQDAAFGWFMGQNSQSGEVTVSGQ